MNKQQRQNMGLTVPVIVIGAIVLFFFLAAPFLKLDGDNPFYNASVAKKILVYLCYGGSAFWLYLCIKGIVYEPTENKWINLLIYVGGFVVPIITAWIIVTA